MFFLLASLLGGLAQPLAQPPPQGGTLRGLREGKWRFFYPNGPLWQTATYRAGSPQGPWTLHDSLGRLRLQAGRWGQLAHGPLVLYAPTDDCKLLEMNYLTGLAEGKWTTYGPAGRPVMQGWLRDGQPDGTWQALGPNGQPLWRASFRTGLPDGPLEWLGEGGLVRERLTYARGKLVGVAAIFGPGQRPLPPGNLLSGQGERWLYTPSGELWAKATYRDSLPHGDLNMLDTAGRAYLRLPYVRGEATGQWRALSPTGTLIHTGELKNGQLDGKFTHFTPQGQSLIQGLYQAGRPVGEWRGWSQGKLAASYRYTQGQVGGPATTYHPDGTTPAAQGPLGQGQPVGQWRFFSPSGAQLAEGTVGPAGAQGEWKFADAIGQPSVSGHFADGQRTGAWVGFHPGTATIAQQGTFRAGARHGEWAYYHPNGQLAQKETWDQGRLQQVGPFYTAKGKELSPGTLQNGTGTRHTYHANGQPAASGDFRDGLPTGIWLYFDQKGKLNCEGQFLAGERTGTWRWYRRGQPEAEGQYAHDQPVGQWKIFGPKGRVETVDF